MDTEYDRKFEEMKKYIPFLENMITRLESTSPLSSNPRQAQLDKIRSLRDLLLNKKKRMKMENLLKCEQVLINLYAKVEQRDTFSGGKKNNPDSSFSIDTPTPKEKSDLEAVRNKLKNVVQRKDQKSTIQRCEAEQDTLPEILTRSEATDVHTSGDKEPALFQRRPNQSTNMSNTQVEESNSKSTSPNSASKRNYTRVLVSPESDRQWSPSRKSIEKPLFSRRSPRKSPKRGSPSYHKKERKKGKESRKQKDLNITLNVPEASLNSLNTKDILSRILNCSDGDVDIDTLRELRKQILGELQKTGAKDDISDLILKSYKNKNKSNVPEKKEIEEGELSDSESEAIESIYGSLVIKEPNETKISSEKDTQPRKIQICLVLNANNTPEQVAKHDEPELEMFEKEKTEGTQSQPNKSQIQSATEDKNNATIDIKTNEKGQNKCISESQKNVLGNEVPEEKDSVSVIANEDVSSKPVEKEVSSDDSTAPNAQETTPFKPNFYKPLTEQNNSETSDLLKDLGGNQSSDSQPKATTPVKLSDVDKQQMEKSEEIPLLHDRTIEKKPPDSTLSEIDILQALKNEILSEIAVPGNDSSTPLLHQPKLMKVSSAQEMLPKKRISIAKYKEKAVSSPRPLYVDNEISPKEQHTKKPSIKLTDKECERFNIPKISIDDEDESLDEDNSDDIESTDVYSDLVPKSPDHDESSNLESAPPVIIPVEPVAKAMPVNKKADVDMRKLPLLSPNNTKPLHSPSPTLNLDTSSDKKKIDKKVERPVLVDPRVRRDLNSNSSNMSPSQNLDRTQRHNAFSGGSTPNPIMTPNSRAYEMTPSHQSFDIDQSRRKHVYVPTLSTFDNRDIEKPKESRPWEKPSGSGERRSRMDDNSRDAWNTQRDNVSQSSRFSDSFNNDNYQSGPMNIPDFVQTSLPSFGRNDPSVTCTQSYSRLEAPMTPLPSFGRSDCPSTPSHPFGRLDCPSTPSHPFGRLDCPPTPSHPFGRLDCPPTPSHPFGRLDCPSTPSHPFGRADCPPTSINPFGRTDCPPTPNHPFGRTEVPAPAVITMRDQPGNPFAGTECPPTPNPIFGNFECQTNASFMNPERPPAQRPFGFPESNQGPYNRPEVIKNQFVRSDFNNQKYSKDPRIHRKQETETKSHYDERDRGYYKDNDRFRGSSYSSKKYGGADSYRNYENRNSRYKYYASERSGRTLNRDLEKRESSVGRSMSRDSESSQSRDRRYYNSSNGYEEIGARRDKSALRSLPQEEYRSRAARASSVGRSSIKESDSMKSNSFQKILNDANEIQAIVNNFDLRRQRAASVGRSLGRESSVGRSLVYCSNKKTDAKPEERKKEAFRRASSVARDCFDHKVDKRSFQEIKADFKSYKLPDRTYNNSIKSESYNTKLDSTGSRSSRKDIYEKQRNERRGPDSSKYSPRKNCRDPRMRRQVDNKNDKYGSTSHSRKSGIVYSNDNIVTGSILRSGYGVKNYKIPKIKRPIEEKETIAETTKKDVKEKEMVKSSDNIQEKQKKEEKLKVKENLNIKEKSTVKRSEVPDTEDISNDSDVGSKAEDQTKDDSKLKEVQEKRRTRSSGKLSSESKTDSEEIAKPKKYKKVIIDSDSDSEISKEETLNTEKIDSISTKPISPEKEKSSNQKVDSVNLDSSFGIEELEMFSDNVVSDPVIDNIHALIADLDNDLGAPKIDSSHNFTNEISLENMLENISSPGNDLLEMEEDSADIIEAIDNITNDKKETKIKKNEINNQQEKDPMSSTTAVAVTNLGIEDFTEDVKFPSDVKAVKDGAENAPTQSDTAPDKVNDTSNDIDSTTDADKDVKLPEENPRLDDQNTDTLSTPDSTITNDDALQNRANEESLPGSTNEVTSTESIESKPVLSDTDKAPSLDSIGSLLSILQDKSKIKEILNMLGQESSENEKIKKKLERLSEIVSDDEETSDMPTAEPSQIAVSSDATLNKVVDSKETTDIEVSNTEDDQLSVEDSTKIEADESKTSDVDIEGINDQNEIKTTKKPVKKAKGAKKTKGKQKKVTNATGKRITRASVAVTKTKPKKATRELLKLQEDIREMFMRDEVLSATGIRNCRLAKLVDEKAVPKDNAAKEDPVLPEVEPVVILEKFKNTSDKSDNSDKIKKKKVSPKSKLKASIESNIESATVDKKLISSKKKPGPKSKTKKESDPYAFETDSVGDTTLEKASDDESSSSIDSENDSLASTKSFGSTDTLAEIKKKTKRKRCPWQSGVIKTKSKKKRAKPKQLTSSTPEPNPELHVEKTLKDDINCFTDLNYCFSKSKIMYDCRLCSYLGADIVLHYKNVHPHVEIPLSRMSPEVATEAIDQCMEINFEKISNVPSDKYVCTFCFQEFPYNKTVLETFFWHIVSMHTGEYKQNSASANINENEFVLDIPTPPKDVKGQLIGYICKECNFTQISLENLKTHVILRHNDEQTAVYKINLSVMTKKGLNSLLRRGISIISTTTIEKVDTVSPARRDSSPEKEKNILKIKDKPLRTYTKKTQQPVSPPIQSKITFEGDDNVPDIPSVIDETIIKKENMDADNTDGVNNELATCNYVEYQHFKIIRTETGTIEYRCSVNGNYHFTTNKLISMNKHVEKVHPGNWDGYCQECKMVVCSQNENQFTDCLKHCRDKHIDSLTVEDSKIEESSMPDALLEDNSSNTEDLPLVPPENEETEPSSDIIDCPHFKMSHTESGAKEYYCCINGDYHFKTTLLISMKKHVQTKHIENWDGYCYVCKVIITPQGVHRFRDCLQHYLDKHMDNFPIFEKDVEPTSSDNIAETPDEVPSAAKSYINVRPLSDLLTKPDDVSQESPGFPVIQSVMSLGAQTVEPPRPSPTFTTIDREAEKIYTYEEHQSVILSKKYELVKQAILTPENLIKYFKCSGRYCTYATDSTEEALSHASTHQRLGGLDALNCCYCSFDAGGNAVDLVIHVFKCHGFSPYCCPQCFYRAASSQAVGEHIKRVHNMAPVAGSVLRTTMVPSIPPVNKTNMLTREEAVSHYLCGHRDRDDSCASLRTYTPDKLREHISQRHANAPAHPCHLCSEESPNALELVRHMKSHGMKLYQCTWCVHGADNESEMLTHVAAVHPDKQPQAYIRMITNKGGTNRVLPLAFLNKFKVQTQDLTPVPTKENAVREAERSIEMEALIAPFVTDAASETAKTQENTEAETPIQTAEISSDVIEIPEDIASDGVPDIQPVDTGSVVVKTERTSTTEAPAIPKTPEVIVPPSPEPSTAPKVAVTQVKVEAKVFDDIVVLDSDEEEEASQPAPTSASVIDLSDDDQSRAVPLIPGTPDQLFSEPSTSFETAQKAKTKILPETQLYKCPKCRQVCKNQGGFKIHLQRCALRPNIKVHCPHCMLLVGNLEKLLWHYAADHSGKDTFECVVCKALLISENIARKHMKSAHKETNVIIVSSLNGPASYTIDVSQRSEPIRILPKRKLSDTRTEAPTPPKRRFEPQEIDQLPINPILDHLVYCSRCEFSTKVRLNMVRHLQQHAEQQPVAQTAPVNPVPHLESNEKHFDKMVNLASSSIVNRSADKQREAPVVTLRIPPEAASRYPKYVHERQRLTCGAKGCSYISVDESMLKHHWEALHSGEMNFHCVHCPPHQHLDTSKPLTAVRVISHLKMHDATLYACSLCPYYHFKREAIEKHFVQHPSKPGRVLIVREECSTPVSPAPTPNVIAPTMDLKPWQCGLCKFKSMLRPEVVDHCAKFHQSKMQFKCTYCPYKSSTIENVSNHQANSHSGKKEEVFYYYYREGTIPDEADGTPRWMKQHQKAEPEPEPEVKVEAPVSPGPKSPESPQPLTIDLNIVKQEVDDLPAVADSIEDLCARFGKFCDPNGIKFKCPLCSVIMDDTRDGMQSHLYEELSYRKWSCGLCSYKAFHKAGLTDHMSSEHRRQYDHIELPVDINIETWVTAVLDHQTTIIEKHKENLVKQKVIDPPKPGPSTEVAPVKETSKYTDKDLSTAFGVFGNPGGSMFSCPKCTFITKEESPMRDHLELELNKIRWCCSYCPFSFTTYHEAQFHCKSHEVSSRPVEAIRDPAMRAAWVSTCIQRQKKRMQTDTTSIPSPEKILPDVDNSLLVVRYEEPTPTPDVVTSRRKRSGVSDNDTEPPAKKKPLEKQCPYCTYKSPYINNIRIHMLTHFDLKPYICGYCKFNGYTKKSISKHIEEMHPDQPVKVKTAELPAHAKKIGESVFCLVCERSLLKTETDTHLHNNMKPVFVSVDVVVKCCLCLTLCPDLEAWQEHHKVTHPGETSNYALYKLGVDSRETYMCAYCSARFKYINDFKAHHFTAHPTMRFNLTSSVYAPPEVNEPGTSTAGPTTQKRIARKSTTKLPNSVAKKSTTKLPYSLPNRPEDGYSYYGTKSSSLDQYPDVTILMSFCNRMRPFTLKQMTELINIEPIVKVVDVNK